LSGVVVKLLSLQKKSSCKRKGGRAMMLRKKERKEKKESIERELYAYGLSFAHMI